MKKKCFYMCIGALSGTIAYSIVWFIAKYQCTSTFNLIFRLTNNDFNLIVQKHLGHGC